MVKKVFIKEIKLAEKSPRNDGLRPVKIVMDNETYHFLKIKELMEILKYWIIGEEEKYPQPICKGRWMLFDEIKKVFDETPIKDFKKEEKQPTLLKDLQPA